MASALCMLTILIAVNLVSSSPIFLPNIKPDGGNLFGNTLGNIGAEALVNSPIVDLCLSVDLFGNPIGCENSKGTTTRTEKTIATDEPTPPCEDSDSTIKSEVTTPSSADSSSTTESTTTKVASTTSSTGSGSTTERITTTDASKTTPTSSNTASKEVTTLPCDDPNSTTAGTTTDCGCE